MRSQIHPYALLYQSIDKFCDTSKLHIPSLLKKKERHFIKIQQNTNTFIFNSLIEEDFYSDNHQTTKEFFYLKKDLEKLLKNFLEKHDPKVLLTTKNIGIENVKEKSLFIEKFYQEIGKNSILKEGIKIPQETLQDFSEKDRTTILEKIKDFNTTQKNLQNISSLLEIPFSLRDDNSNQKKYTLYFRNHEINEKKENLIRKIIKEDHTPIIPLYYRTEGLISEPSQTDHIPLMFNPKPMTAHEKMKTKKYLKENFGFCE